MTDTRLTKADTVALWHAIEWMALCLKQTPADEPGLPAERDQLAAAKRALRKVNAIRKAQGSAPRPHTMELPLE